MSGNKKSRMDTTTAKDVSQMWINVANGIGDSMRESQQRMAEQQARLDKTSSELRASQNFFAHNGRYPNMWETGKY